MLLTHDGYVQDEQVVNAGAITNESYADQGVKTVA